MLLAPYAEDEVRALVSHYNVLRYHRHRLWIMVRLLDLEQAIHNLDETERGVLVLHGIHGWPQRQVADALDISQSTVGRVYHRVFPKLAESMNGHGQTHALQQVP